jgi:hypothetical protein
MSQPPSLDKVVLDGLMSRDEPRIAAALEQAVALGWGLSQARQALIDLFNPVLDAGYLEEWPDLDNSDVPGPRLEYEAGAVPLVSVLKRLPAVVPYLPWLPGILTRFSLYSHHQPFHDIPFDELEELHKNPVWRLDWQTHDWRQAATALVEMGGSVWEPRDLTFDSYFEYYGYLGEALKAQAADAGGFLLGAQVEFEGNHNDAEFSVVMARLVEEPVQKPGRRRLRGGL